jgi:oxygen-independent coproporphyrinogen-3 oxidase
MNEVHRMSMRPTRAIRDLLIGERGRFVFESRAGLQLPDIASADVYIHIPFCRSLCPYCPYNRVLYDPAEADDYLGALHCEIDRYAAILGDIEIGSVYIGGGTPTTVIDDLGRLVAHLRERFRHDGLVAVETTPEDLDAVNTAKLRDAGIDLLSIGVQSFDDRYLKYLGRRHRSAMLERVIQGALAAGFDTVNLDLMFALPGQTTEEALADLDTAISLGAEQVTLYPLFTFPYSTVGRHLRLTNVDFPRLGARRQMYRAIHEHALANGFERVSVWGFRKGATERFSSVTRDHYIGLGAGAATCLPGTFYFNTFSIPAYTQRSRAQESTVSLQMDMSAAMTRFYWLYWRLYETHVPKAGFERRFADDTRLRLLLQLAVLLGLITDIEGDYVLTERGAFWIHLMQNYYVLNYIDKVWSRSMREAWPGRIEL